MYNFIRSLFCHRVKVVDMLVGTEFDDNEGCYLFLVENGCGPDSVFGNFPKLIEDAMKNVVAKQASGDHAIWVKSKGVSADQQERKRIYDSIQITPNRCTCRVKFGGDKTQKSVETASSINAPAGQMERIIMTKFDVDNQDWATNQDQPETFASKAPHQVINRYYLHKNDCIMRHQDVSGTYHTKNPITSFSWGCGAWLEITNNNSEKRKTALFYKFPGNAIVMSGMMNATLWHGVPEVSRWKTLMSQTESDGIVRRLPDVERVEAERQLTLIDEGNHLCRYNETLRWHEFHNENCPLGTETNRLITTAAKPTGENIAASSHLHSGRPLDGVTVIDDPGPTATVTSEPSESSGEVCDVIYIASIVALRDRVLKLFKDVPFPLFLVTINPLMPSKATEANFYKELTLSLIHI